MQDFEASQEGYSEHTVQLFWVQLLPSHEVTLQAGSHRYEFKQVAGGVGPEVHWPLLVQFLMLDV